MQLETSCSKRAEDDNEYEFKRRFREAELRYQDEADERARDILAASLQRLASDVVGEASVTSIPIPSEDVKGRLIGREGRNIRAIEANTGVDLLVDDTPDTVAISCFDPIRREVARVASGATHQRWENPTRAHRRRRAQISPRSRFCGSESRRRRRAGCRGTWPPPGTDEIDGTAQIPLLLRRKRVAALRRSRSRRRHVGIPDRGQCTSCKTAGFLHDIGKALTHEVEGRMQRSVPTSQRNTEFATTL